MFVGLSVEEKVAKLLKVVAYEVYIKNQIKVKSFLSSETLLVNDR